MIKRLKKFLRKKFLSFDHSNNYFAQGGEDSILRKILVQKFINKQKGFYVDIGAYHPYLHSNTYYFYLNGWSGINIDPSPGSMELFNKLRKRDINLEIGVGPQNDDLIFYYFGKQSTRNSFSKDALVSEGIYQKVQSEIPVKVFTLEEILDKHNTSFKKLDFLSIDVEGFEYEVLQSNNWEKYKPDVIVVELNSTLIDDLKSNISAQLLCSLGYKIVAKNVINRNIASVFFVIDGYEY